ncbi:MAG: sulfate/molybdate ABC transporter ATP-binding protein [Planctomycetaceae bacterium]|nr:sulfate/molybdate ABC transporter ATP-binding protein [Planctomycetaceae bacterium]
MAIRIDGVTKQFGAFRALDDVSLVVPQGSLLALLGPSGSGKTTLLRIIAGLETADGGHVYYDDQDVTQRSARDRNVGFVFQHYALFRHMNVFENVAFGLRVRKVPKAEIHRRVEELIGLVRLSGMERRLPSQLSGGQRQRVALARALAIRPQVLLLDEPFGALDAKVRQELRQWLRRLHDEIGMTSVFVTHDQEEAFEVADEVVVMNKGRIEQHGTPRQVFDQPANPFVMDFLGHVNVFSGRVQNGKAHWGGVEVEYPDYPHGESREAAVYVRPHELDIERFEGDGALKIEVKRVNPTGSIAKIYGVSVDFGSPVHVELPAERYSELELREGEVVYVAPRRVRVFLPEYSI